MNDLKPGKGKCYVLKKMFLAYVLEEAGKMWPFEVVAALREVTQSHVSFRRMYEGEEGQRDLAFMSGWPTSARFLLYFVGKAVLSHLPPSCSLSRAWQKATPAHTTPRSKITHQHAEEEKKKHATRAANLRPHAGNVSCGSRTEDNDISRTSTQGRMRKQLLKLVKRTVIMKPQVQSVRNGG